jgi:hypothetical protein
MSVGRLDETRLGLDWTGLDGLDGSGGRGGMDRGFDPHELNCGLSFLSSADFRIYLFSDVLMSLPSHFLICLFAYFLLFGLSSFRIC